MTGQRLRELASDVPCLRHPRQPDCDCSGCMAEAAIMSAASLLDDGRLLEADLKLGHAAYIYRSLPVQRAQQELHAMVVAAAASAEVQP